MKKRKLVVIFKGGEVCMIEIIKMIGKYKAPISLTTRRGDCILETTLSPSTIKKNFPGWNIKHETEKRIVLAKD